MSPLSSVSILHSLPNSLVYARAHKDVSWLEYTSIIMYSCIFCTILLIRLPFIEYEDLFRYCVQKVKMDVYAVDISSMEF